nr:ATP-binding protein [Collinsella sp. An307]
MLESREGRGSTMFASQLEPDQWYLRINSELCADSILNRAVEHARVLDIKGPNMREYTAGLKAEMEKGYWD